MRTLMLFVALFFVAACDPPLQPSAADITITTINNNGGDTTHDHHHDDAVGDDDGNAAPVILTIPSQRHTVGDVVSIQLIGSDADNDALTWRWEANEAPRDFTVTSTGPTTAVLAGIVSSSSPLDSPYTVRVFASDGKAETQAIFLWIIDPAPVVP